MIITSITDAVADNNIIAPTLLVVSSLSSLMHDDEDDDDDDDEDEEEQEEEDDDDDQYEITEEDSVSYRNSMEGLGWWDNCMLPFKAALLGLVWG